ncbi:MAG: right-handed parallel beta-helix repeat-containing protein [Anaerolineae bacterium]|nr:right-handed parallel beta-helix repeat-containing protein [Anaerolineae bacterium]
MAVGGAHIYYHSTAILNNNRVANNISEGGLGGGLLIDSESDVTLNSNTIISNTAAGDFGNGGGLLFAYGSTGELTNNLIADNKSSRGSGLDVWGSQVKLLHTTIAHNCGGDSTGIIVVPDTDGNSATITVTNTILVSHTVGISVASGCTATLEATLWGTDTWANQVDWGGAGNIVTGSVNVWAEPGFTDPGNGDYHLLEMSAARDVGIDAGVRTDIDGQPRPFGSGYDLGADEYVVASFGPRAYLPVVLKQ